jgi:hypothetical protein
VNFLFGDVKYLDTPIKRYQFVVVFDSGLFLDHFHVVPDAGHWFKQEIFLQESRFGFFVARVNECSSPVGILDGFL